MADHPGSQQRVDRGFVELPGPLPFGVYGLDDSFPGARVLGLWDSDNEAGKPMTSETVYRVRTCHHRYGVKSTITMHTVHKVPRPGWPFGTFPYGFADASGSAISGALGNAEWVEEGFAGGFDLLDALRLSDDPDNPRWQRTRVTLGGVEVEAFYYPIGQAWVAAMELDDVAIAVSDVGASAADYEVVPVDPGQYAARPWPRSWGRRSIRSSG